MGNSTSKKDRIPKFSTIADNYQTLEEVQEALRKAGLESSNLILGIGFTGSNKDSGTISFGGKCLHHISPGVLNPYQEVIEIVGKTLEPFDDDKLIPVFGFGDRKTRDHSVFPFYEDRVCNGFVEVLKRYEEIAPTVELYGPTSFAALIRAAIDIVKKERAYHILVIIADGKVDRVKETSDAIIEATNYPLSIITIGVGDGPAEGWKVMEEFDDKLPKRRFDNFQFVPFNKVMEKAENREVTFSVNALQEIPEQYSTIKKLGLLG